MTDRATSRPSLRDQLKRRRVLRVVVMYLGAGFVVLQGAELLVEVFQLPPLFLTGVGVVVVLGLPLAVGLGWIFDVTPEGVRRTDSDAVLEASAGTAPPPRWLSLPVLGLFGGFVAVGVLLGVSARWLPPAGSEPAPGVRRFHVLLPDSAKLAFVGSEPIGVGMRAFDLAPDGTALVYAGTRASGGTALYMRPLDGTAIRFVEGTEGAYAPAVSPDSRWVAFLAQDQVKKVALAGGAPITLAAAANVTAIGWWGNDRILFADREGRRLLAVSAEGGEPRVVTTASRSTGGFAGGRIQSMVDVLDEGRALYGTADGNVVVVDLGSGQAESLIADAGSPRLAGEELFFTRAGDLFAVPFSRRSGRLAGDPVLVATAVRTEARGRHAQYSAIPGLVLYTPGTQDMVGRLEWVTRDGAVTRTPLPDFRFSYDFDLSPDGEAVVLGLDHGRSELWLYELDTGRGQRLGGGAVDRVSPRWMGDDAVLFRRREPASSSAYRPWVMRSDGTGETPFIDPSTDPDPDAEYFMTGIGSDGVATGFKDADGSGADIGLLFPDGLWKPFERPGSEEIFGIPSPDDRWILHNSDASGRYEVYVVDRDGGSRTRISFGGGDDPFWAPDGDEVFYRQGTTMMAVRVRDSDGRLVASRPEALFDDPAWINLAGLSAAVHPDGTRFLLARSLQEPFAREIEVLERPRRRP